MTSCVWIMPTAFQMQVYGFGLYCVCCYKMTYVNLEF